MWRADDRLQLTIRDSGNGLAAMRAGDAANQVIRDRLAKLYAQDARLTLQDVPDGTEAVMDIPRESLFVGTPR